MPILTPLWKGSPAVRVALGYSFVITGRNSPARNTEPVMQMRSSGPACSEASSHASAGVGQSVEAGAPARFHSAANSSGGTLRALFW